MLGKLHLGEVSFPDGFKKPVFSYVGLLACPPPGHSGARLALTNIKVKNTPEVFRKHIFKFTPPFESLGVFRLTNAEAFLGNLISTLKSNLFLQILL